MLTPFRIVATLLSFTVATLLLAQQTGAVKDKLAHRYSIYYASPYEESDMASRYGSHLWFLQPDSTAAASYVYYIAADRIKRGRVTDYEYHPNEHARVYRMECFFEGGADARAVIVDVEADSNVKIAYIGYADPEDDHEGGLLQTYMLIDDEQPAQLQQPVQPGGQTP